MVGVMSTVCGLAIVLAAMGGGMAAAVTMPGQAALLAGTLEGRTLVAAENTVDFSVGDIEAEPGKDVPLTIKLPSSAELRGAGADTGTFLLIRNVPEGVGMSAGMATGRIWVVPLREAAGLRLTSKPDLSARFQLGFHLIGPNNRVLAETTVSVDLRPREAVAAVNAVTLQDEPPKPDPPKKPAQQPSQTAPLPPAEEAVLLARGQQLLQQGGIVAARLIFEELATHRSAAGALALARSYDPAYVPPSKASAPAPDMAEARKWYERAVELGNPDAQRRLAEIGAGG
jgi:hypothetical protein